MVCPLRRERKERDLVLCSTGNTVQFDPRIGRQRLQNEVPHTLTIVSVLQTGSKIQSRLQGWLRIEILGSRLEFGRQRGIGRARKTHGPDHLSAAHIGDHLFQQGFFSIQDAGTRRRIHFVAGKSVEITVQILHIHSPVHHALRAIDQNH